MTEADFLGQGWAFPVLPDAGGDVGLVVGPEDVRQAVRLILETAPGERVMRPDFGAGLRRRVFDPINASTIALVRHAVEQALVAWEPRIELERVAVTTDQQATGRLDIEIRYRIRATNTFYNLVYPFYLHEGRS